MKNFNVAYFGSFSRDALRILRFMVNKYPKKRIFSSEELGQTIRLKDKALGGVLGTFSKRKDLTLIIKIGTVFSTWEGRTSERPKQMWALNPKLEKSEIKQIEKSLQNFLLDQ